MASTSSRPPGQPSKRLDNNLSISSTTACVKGDAKEGIPCSLGVNVNKSAASVKMYRDTKVVDSRTDQCGSYWKARADITKGISLKEFADNLRDGKYSGSLTQEGGSCYELTATPEQYNAIVSLSEANISDGGVQNTLNNNKTALRLRKSKVTYSSENKLTIIPNIPFELDYNGKDKIIVSKMTLFHPSPVRIENIQHDAVLTLNDPADNPAYVVMIPLVSSSFNTPSTAFLSRISSRFGEAVIPNSAQNYREVDVATGSDWSISNLFNMSGDGISVTDSFYTWKGVSTSVRYILMEKPAFISAGDLTTLRNLPPVNPEFAIDGIPQANTDVLYRKSFCCGTKTTSTKESFGNKGRAGIQVNDIANWIIIGIFALLGLGIALYIVLQTSIAESMRDGVIMFGSLISKQFDKLSGGVQLPSVPQLQLPSTSQLQLPQGIDLSKVQLPQQLDLKNLSNSEEIPPALKGLADNPALQKFASSFGKG